VTLLLDILKTGAGPLLVVLIIPPIPPIFIIGGPLILLVIEVDLIIVGLIVLYPPIFIIGGALIVLVIEVDLIIDDIPPQPLPEHFAE
jgi:hypothetical protein